MTIKLCFSQFGLTLTNLAMATTIETDHNTCRAHQLPLFGQGWPVTTTKANEEIAHCPTPPRVLLFMWRHPEQTTIVLQVDAFGGPYMLPPATCFIGKHVARTKQEMLPTLTAHELQPMYDYWSSISQSRNPQTNEFFRRGSLLQVIMAAVRISDHLNSHWLPCWRLSNYALGFTPTIQPD